jgi:hypothetical protein
LFRNLAAACRAASGDTGSAMIVIVQHIKAVAKKIFFIFIDVYIIILVIYLTSLA